VTIVVERRAGAVEAGIPATLERNFVTKSLGEYFLERKRMLRVEPSPPGAMSFNEMKTTERPSVPI
jgi:hypothetical protein